MANLYEIVERLENIQKILETRLPEVEEKSNYDKMLDAIRVIMCSATKVEIIYNNKNLYMNLEKDLEDEFDVCMFEVLNEITISKKE